MQAVKRHTQPARGLNHELSSEFESVTESSGPKRVMKPEIILCCHGCTVKTKDCQGSQACWLSPRQARVREWNPPLTGALGFQGKPAPVNACHTSAAPNR
ncbi:hypothetical protein PoB_003207000 [Plakobranchus ocellatus]|uniref:Uncharacterized protein n=1 Tax=Plakobranchus ocellatus TaxID=259542 RepID=A0AAV4AFN0_9GAST|nr:hypothetical protein PoB_003207000 [Plakobranchus ocellatus]